MSQYSDGVSQLRRTSQVNVQCLVVDNQEPFLFLAGRTLAGLAAEVSSVTEMILSAPILRAWWHLGQAAICVAGKLESASATTFTGVPHLQRHNTRILAMWDLLH